VCAGRRSALTRGAVTPALAHAPCRAARPPRRPRSTRRPLHREQVAAVHHRACARAPTLLGRCAKPTGFSSADCTPPMNATGQSERLAPAASRARLSGRALVDGVSTARSNAQHTPLVVTLALAMRAVGDVVPQHVVRSQPATVVRLWRKWAQCLGLRWPRLLRRLPAHRARARRAHQPATLFSAPERRGTPAAQRWASPAAPRRAPARGGAGRRHQARKTRRTSGRPARPAHRARSTCGRRRNQPARCTRCAPVVADRVAWVVAKALDGAHLEAARLQVTEQHTIGAGAEAVGVEKKQGHLGQISLLAGVVIFLSGRLRPTGPAAAPRWRRRSTSGLRCCQTPGAASGPSCRAACWK